jgi:putative transposase
MQYLNSAYARVFNEVAERRGYLFEKPYRSVPLVTDSHALEACRYVDLNPIRAGICANAAAYRWSSYRATVGLTQKPRFLQIDWLLSSFDADRSRAMVKYSQFVEEGARAYRPRDAA